MRFLDCQLVMGFSMQEAVAVEVKIFLFSYSLYPLLNAVNSKA